MPHLIDELSQSLPPVPAGVRESRYGGADEDTQFVTTPGEAAPGVHLAPAADLHTALPRRPIPSQAGPKPCVKRADLHDVVLSALAHLAGCTGQDGCTCDVDPDLVENTTRDVVTNLVGVLRTAGVGVEERVGDAWDVAPSGACGRCCPPNDAGCGHECHQTRAGVPF